MRHFRSVCLLFTILLSSQAYAREEEESGPKYRHSVGSSAFVLINFLPDSADYGLLTYGYRLTENDRVYAEFNTWKYDEPYGTYGSSEAFYPGYVRAFGLGIGYQRFFWRGLYGAISATPHLKQYYDENDKKIQKGFQLYTQVIAGYRFEFFDDRFHIEPAYALKNWPIDTNFPDDFAEVEKGKPKFIFEPSLNVGVRF